MFLSSLWKSAGRSRTSVPAHVGRSASGKRPQARPLRCEPLEDRQLLSVAPGINWATYLGGSSLDWGYSVAVDKAGDTFVTGCTQSLDLAGANNSYHGGAYDAFVAKVNADGTLAWATYLGGSGISTNDWGDRGMAIAVDGAGNALVTGWTDSSDFAGGANNLGANNAYHGNIDAFVAKVNSDGTEAWATYLGGSTGVDEGFGIAVDGAGNAFVTGETYSTDFAGANNSFHGSAGAADAFVAEVTSGGSLVWATYLGGSSGASGRGIALDGAGNALVTGETTSTDFAGANNSSHGGEDAFVAKVTSGGSLVWATYLGGSGSDQGSGIAVDSAGNALVTGKTSSTDFAGANNSYHGGTDDAFVAKVTSGGSLVWATYLGGSGADNSSGYPTGIAVDGAGNALVTGDTASTDFAGANNSYLGGPQDAFVAKVTSGGSLAWATYLGGSGDDVGRGIALDSAGNVLVTGTTSSTDFAGANNSYQGGTWDVFVAKLNPALYYDATKFHVVNDASQDQTYDYNSGGGLNDSYNLTSGNTAPRGVATTVAGGTTWVVDANRNVYVYNTSGGLLGSWTAGTLATTANVQDITVYGNDVWIVDAKSDKVFYYKGAASLLSGSQNATSSFSLNSSNKNPTGIVTDGTYLWVVDATTTGKTSTDKVFKYTLAGSLVGSWTISTSGAASPTGLTIDPTGASQDIWIVDSGTDKVYDYANARGKTSGSLAASAFFTLAPGNTNPQGIADPPPSGSMVAIQPSALSASVSPTLADAALLELAGRNVAADSSLSASATVAPTGSPLSADLSLGKTSAIAESLAAPLATAAPQAGLLNLAASSKAGDRAWTAGAVDDSLTELSLSDLKVDLLLNDLALSAA